MMKMLKKMLSDKEKRLRVIFFLGCAGVVLIVLPDFLPERKSTAVSDSGILDPLDETEEYRISLEKRLTEVISSISGAGETKVMISVGAAKEYVYAEKSDVDRRTQNEGESLRSQGEPVLNGQDALLKTVLVPKVSGAAVICEGAADPVTRERVMNTASAVLGIAVSKISVQPLSPGEERFPGGNDRQ